MNILFVFERKIVPSFGGLERVTHLLATGLREQGVESFFLSVGPREWNTNESEEGFFQEYVPVMDENFRERLRLLVDSKKIEAIIFQGHHRDVLKALELAPQGVKKFTVFHLQPFGMVGKERKIRQVTPSASLNIKGKLLKYLAILFPRVYRSLYRENIRKIFKRMAANSDRLVLLSDRFIPRLVSNFPGIDQRKIFAINNPLTFNSNEELFLDKKENIVLFVGRMYNPQKNVTGFIDVWKRFSATHPDWKAMIVGDGEDMTFIKDYAKQRKVERLSFEGPSKNIGDYYRKSKIYCMTSSYEGWGMVLTEAMACGCVPVAFDSYESIHDIIDNDVDGVLIKPFDTKAMAKAMDVLAANESLRIRMAEAARKKILSWDNGQIVDEWIRLVRTSSQSRT